MKFRNYDPFVAGLIEATSSQIRLDANETANLERALVFVKSNLVHDLYKLKTARSVIVHVDNEVPSDVETYSYWVQSITGKATMGASGTDSWPLVGANSHEVFGKVHKVKAAYEYTVEDLARAARTGQSLPTRLMQAAMEVMELGIDTALYTGTTGQAGESNLTTTGLLNCADVAEATDFSSTWDSGFDDAVMIAELEDLIASVGLATGGARQTNVVALPYARFVKASTTRVGVELNKTVLQVVKEAHPEVEFHQMAGVETLGDNAHGRAVAFNRSILSLGAVIPQEFTMLPPQPKNDKFYIPCQAKCGGTKIYEPFSFMYKDFA